MNNEYKGLLDSLITDIPICNDCIILREMSGARTAQYLRCPACSEKICSGKVWLKCPECNEDWTYLVYPGSGEIDYTKLAEHTICSKCKRISDAEDYYKQKSKITEE